MSAPTTTGCPRCGADNMQEQSYRYTFQNVYGLDAEGDGQDYDSFDYGDDVWTIGWECRSCQWSAIGDEGPVAAALEAAREDAGRKLAAAHELRAGILLTSNAPEKQEALDRARQALDGDSNDDEHDALVDLVGVLS